MLDRQREDEHVACRGSIAMAVATLHPSSDGSRFEIHSQVHSSVPKMIVKSSHRAEIARWIQALKLNIDFYSKQDPNTGSTQKRATSFSSTKAAPTIAHNPPAVPQELPSNGAFMTADLQRTTTALSSLSVGKGQSLRSPSPARSSPADDAGDSLSLYEAMDRDSVLGGGDQNDQAAGVPHEAEFDLAVLNIKEQTDLAKQLVDSLSSQSSISADLAQTDSSQGHVKQALQQSLITLSTLISRQMVMTQDRERYYLGRIQREVEARKMWEENMLTVAKQQAETDEQLNQAARVNEKKRKALRQARGVLDGLRRDSALPTSPSANASDAATLSALDAALKSPASGVMSPAPGASISNMQEIDQARQAVVDAESDSEDDEDEFFDAIESNNLVNLSMHESIANPDKERAGTPGIGQTFDKQLTAPIPGSTKITDLLARASLQPYLHVRQKLPIDDDKRPSVSCQ